jgi:HEPN domain-containing protein
VLNYLYLKAVLKAVGIEYPKIHDISDILVDFVDRFPEWFRAELEFLRESSKMLAKKREISLYGGEEAFLSPEEVISESDAEDATRRAGKAHELCKKLIDSINVG